MITLKDPTKLFLLGFATLFLELALIRYLAGNIWNLGYFPNLVLLAVFVGMGIGFTFHDALSDARSALWFRFVPSLLLLLVLFVALVHPTTPGFGSWGEGNIGGDLYFTNARPKSAARSMMELAFWFASTALIFTVISQRTAKLFRLMPPLRAYTFDILGSCCGILSFMALSRLQAPAYSWFLLLAPLLLLAQPILSARKLLTPLMCLLAVAAIARYQDGHLTASRGYRGSVDTRWSPYQKVEYVKTPAQTIFVNGIAHQDLHDATFLRSSFYQLPYSSRSKLPGLGGYKDVLVLGAGSGNDVATALMNGAEHVDAVEIDPVIAQMGKDYHPQHPYQDPRVTLVVDDGRAFMVRTRRQYDLIIFALTDSLVKVSPMSQLRLENYLFTEESVARANRLLKPGGDLLFYNFYRRPWLTRKIEQMLHTATGHYPVRLWEDGSFMVLAAGEYHQLKNPAPLLAQSIEPPSDDWPFLYLKERGVPSAYLYAMAIVGSAIALLMLILEKASGRRRAAVSPDASLLPLKLGFFLMGTAFLLLETKSVIQFALLFGTTWINNSLVFLGILILVLAANWAATLIRKSLLPYVFVLLLGSCLLPLAFPLAHLLSVESTGLRFLLASLMTFSPIFFANLIFSVYFRDLAVPEHIFGWNLLGSTLGGVIEYSSLALGYNALAILVAICYGAVFLLFAWSATAAGSPVPSRTRSPIPEPAAV